MQGLTATQKLFNAIVVLGMAVGCSSNASPPVDASADNNNGGNDSAAMDVSNPGMDAGADSFPAWFGC